MAWQNRAAQSAGRRCGGTRASTAAKGTDIRLGPLSLGRNPPQSQEPEHFLLAPLLSHHYRAVQQPASLPASQPSSRPASGRASKRTSRRADERKREICLIYQRMSSRAALSVSNQHGTLLSAVGLLLLNSHILSIQIKQGKEAFKIAFLAF